MNVAVGGDRRRMRVVLLNPYEIGRQPFGLAQPAALLEQAGCEVDCVDLSLQRLDEAPLAQADFVGIYLAMHTATRIALEALPRIRAAAPQAQLCAYGLYAPMNEPLLRAEGIGTVLGGEFEPGLLAAVARARAGRAAQAEAVVSLDRVEFVRPRRAGLPALSRYARLLLPDGAERVCGFAEASRGCKHLCSHCPVVPVYQGRFRAVPREVVLDDIRQQVAAGAAHISFGDPDFFNGPTHARRLVTALHDEFPALSYDCTIKIEHLLRHRDLLALLRDTGCLFVTSAVESVDDRILGYFRKQHTAADFVEAVALMREHDLNLAPTFVAFTPWTTLDGYCRLLATLAELSLVASVPPIQLAIRLLVPEGSYLLREPAMREHLLAFERATLGYPWCHPDPRVDALHAEVQGLVESGEAQGLEREGLFSRIWALAHAAAGHRVPALAPGAFGAPIPRLSEQWYCCAEPTQQQLRAL